MIRTQVYITSKQHALLKKKAHAENVTLSEALRKVIDKDLLKAEKVHRQQPHKNWFRSVVKEVEQLGGEGPSDLASNVDEYLYGGKK